uniref:Uncharacterized protein n=1 Tax=Rhizophora mucronata TaxID=61149 RepID=A0A2P2MIZ9_RHIMU
MPSQVYNAGCYVGKESTFLDHNLHKVLPAYHENLSQHVASSQIKNGDIDARNILNHTYFWQPKAERQLWMEKLGPCFGSIM